MTPIQTAPRKHNLKKIGSVLAKANEQFLAPLGLIVLFIAWNPNGLSIAEEYVSVHAAYAFLDNKIITTTLRDGMT